MLLGQRLSRDDALSLVHLGRDDLPGLVAAAWQVRRAVFGRDVAFCAIGSAKTGGCSEDCRWCAQSARYHTHLPPQAQQADPAALIDAARESAAQQAGSFGLVSSGAGPKPEDVESLGATARKIADQTDLVVCASLGILDEASARMLVEHGVRRYNHNLETSRRYFAEMVSTHDYDSRLRTLQIAREAGLELCCGGLFGMGETWEDRIDLALTLRDQVGPTVTPLNFLHPIPGTPLGELQPLPPAECLAIIAIFRLLLPEVDLKIAGGRQVALREMQSWIFHAGATSCLVGNYLTTIGRKPAQDRQMVADAGLRLVERLAPKPLSAIEAAS